MFPDTEPSQIFNHKESEMIESIKDYIIGAPIFFVFYFVLPGAWFTGLFQAVEEGSFFWFVTNMMIPPLGIISGLIHWFS